MPGPSPLRTYLRRAGVFAAAAVVMNLLLLGLGTVAGGSFLVPPFAAGQAEIQVGVGPVVIATLLGLAVGFAVAAAPVARRAARGVRVLQVLGALLVLVSLASPALADTDTTTKVVLAVMHLVAGAAYVVALQPFAVRSAQSGSSARARRGETSQAV